MSFPLTPAGMITPLLREDQYDSGRRHLVRDILCRQDFAAPIS